MVLSNRPEALTSSSENEDEYLDLPKLPRDIESDEPELETTFHLKQLLLFISCLEWFWRDRQDFFIGGNLTIYYREDQLEGIKYRGPDIFVVLNTERRERRSWAVWAEGGRYPNFILELLSNSTARKDRNEKKLIYQNTFRTPEYFWFHPETLEFKGFRLSYTEYEDIVPNEQGWLWSEELQLYLGVLNNQLRFFTPDGDLVSTPEESATQNQQQAEEAVAELEAERQRAEAERQRAEAERQRAEAERQRAERLEEYLRSQGIDPTAL